MQSSAIQCNSKRKRAERQAAPFDAAHLAGSTAQVSTWHIAIRRDSPWHRYAAPERERSVPEEQQCCIQQSPKSRLSYPLLAHTSAPAHAASRSAMLSPAPQHALSPIESAPAHAVSGCKAQGQRRQRRGLQSASSRSGANMQSKTCASKRCLEAQDKQASHGVLPQGLQPPPQSTAVSLWFCTPSLQVPATSVAIPAPRRHTRRHNSQAGMRVGTHTCMAAPPRSAVR